MALISCQSLMSCSAKCTFTEWIIIHAKAKNEAIVARLMKKVSRVAREKGRCHRLLAIRNLKHISHAAHGLNQFRLKVIIDFGAQTLNGDIDGVGIAVKIHIPDLRGNQ